MNTASISLKDRFDITKNQVLLNGTQALVRLMLMQKERDRRAGLNTAGLVTGYRGSPLGAVDMQMQRAERELHAADVVFQPGLNEDLAATALWGSQQAELRGEGRFDGVFGLWYGKGPGVDRTGDVMRHANMAGTSKHGGIIMAMGDDHTGESSTVLHQSDFAMVDVSIPVISPAGVQEVLDLGLYAYALSRFSGLWTGLKTIKDTVESTAIVDGGLDRVNFVIPDFDMPEGGLNIRLIDTPHAQEIRLIAHKRRAAVAFARANRIDRRMHGKPGAKIGFVAAGKNWLDLVHAFSLLGITDGDFERLGLTTYKVAQTWPLDEDSIMEWAEGLDLLVVVEEKRKLIEVQIREVLFDNRGGRRVYGLHKESAGGFETLFPIAGALEPVDIAQKLGAILIEEGRGSEAVTARMEKLATAGAGDNQPDVATRMPYFCSGCPHNRSTKVPEGSRAYAGIGCHYMVQWMDRSTNGFTHMGGEGANWIGEAPFSKTPHVFQNLGDGTYNHSGIQAIRAAVAAGTNITYKILYNDAVAMTGGQANEGGLDAPRIAAELRAFGVKDVAIVYDEKEDVDPRAFPGLTLSPRAELDKVQRRLRDVPGVSAILYIQTCAAEKRRRRKRGNFPDPDRRLYINPEICEGCGDCGVQSNCVSLVPLETRFGTKRAIDQSSCNKDYSCLNGFCPSFVTLKGARPKKPAPVEIDLPDLPEVELPAIDGTYNIVVTGVGGTGVVTIGAVLAQAAQIDGRGAGMMEMAGLAQKGGAVHIHCRIGETQDKINAIRVARGEGDLLLGGDLVVSAGAKTLELMDTAHGAGVVNTHEIVTGDFTKNPDFRLPSNLLKLTLEAKLKDRLCAVDFSALARALLGDTIFSNMMILGAAWQRGWVPLSRGAIFHAIALNGAAVENNQRAFDLGRWAVLYPEDAVGRLNDKAEAPQSLEEAIAMRASHLEDYQDAALAAKYRQLLGRIQDENLREIVSRSYHKLLSYKDEYEVARLLLQSADQAEDAFDGISDITYHLAPPMLPGRDASGRPKKRSFGRWIERPLGLLARMKHLRGGVFDPFGYSSERRMERGLIAEFEKEVEQFAFNTAFYDPKLVQELMLLPLNIRGFGPVKMANAEKAAARRKELLDALRQAAPSQAA